MRNFVITITPSTLPRKRVTGAWTQNGTYPDVWQAPVGGQPYDAGSQLVPHVSYPAAGGLSSQVLDYATGEWTALALATSLANCDATADGYWFDGEYLYVNFNGDGPDDRAVFYYVNFIGANYRWWYCSQNAASVRFSDLPPALPFLQAEKLLLEETVSAFKSLSIVANEISVPCVNPMEATGLRHFANVTRGADATMQVPIDDQAFTEAAVSLYEGDSQDGDLALSPDDPATPYALVFKTTVRAPAQYSSVLERPIVDLVLNKVLSNLDVAGPQLDTVGRVTILTDHANEVLPRVYGTRIIKGYVSDAHELATVESVKMIHIKLCDGPLEAVEWIKINDSDPIEPAQAADGDGPLIDLETGWLALPAVFIEPYSTGDYAQDLVTVKVKGRVSQAFALDNFDERLVDLGACGLQPWTNISGFSFSGDQLTTTTTTLSRARAKVVASNNLPWPAHDAVAVKVRFRRVTAYVTGSQFLRFGFNRDAPRPIQVAVPNDTSTVEVLIHETGIAIGTAVDVKVCADGLATTGWYRELCVDAVDFGSGETVEILEVTAYRVGHVRDVLETYADVALSSGELIDNPIPDGRLEGQALESVRYPASDGEWIADSDKVFKGNYAIKLLPFEALILEMPSEASDYAGTGEYRLITLFASLLLPYNRMLPLRLVHNMQNSNLAGAGPSRAVRETFDRFNSRVDNCYWSRVTSHHTASDDFSVQYLPPMLPITSVTAGEFTLATFGGPLFGAQACREFFKVGDQLLFVEQGDGGPEYRASPSSPASPVFVTGVSMPTGVTVKVTTSATGFTHAGPLYAAHAMPLYVGGVFVNDNFVQISETLRDLMSAINVSGVVDTEASLVSILGQLYLETGLLPYATRNGKLGLKFIGSLSHGGVIELTDTPAGRNYDPESLKELGDSERMWITQINGQSGYDPVTRAFAFKAVSVLPDFKLRSARELQVLSLNARWLPSLGRLRHRMRDLLLQRQSVRGYALRVLNPVARDLRPGDVVKLSYAPLGVDGEYCTVKTVRDNTFGGGEYCDVVLTNLAFYSALLPVAFGDDALFDGSHFFA